jgi:hypothetical protein
MKWQMDQVSEHMDGKEVEAFKADTGADIEEPRK